MSPSKAFRLASFAALYIFGISTASATFIDRGGGMIYDDVLNITWLQDFNYAMSSGYDEDGLMTWDAATAWAGALTVGGYTDWRLPTFDPSNPRPSSPTLTNESGSLWSQLGGGGSIGSETDISPFYNLSFEDYVSEWYWTGLESADDNTRAWRISFNCACWDAPLKTEEFHAIAVRSGDVTPVPEPSTLALLSLGIAGLGFAKRRKSN